MTSRWQSFISSDTRLERHMATLIVITSLLMVLIVFMIIVDTCTGVNALQLQQRYSFSEYLRIFRRFGISILKGGTQALLDG